jgi:hypothetical protein
MLQASSHLWQNPIWKELLMHKGSKYKENTLDILKDVFKIIALMFCNMPISTTKYIS